MVRLLNVVVTAAMALAVTGLAGCSDGATMDESQHAAKAGASDSVESDDAGEEGDDKASAGRLQFTAALVSTGEGSGVVTVTVVRAGGDAGRVRVRFATADGSATAARDYEPATGTLEWKNGDSEPKSFTIAIHDDPEGESDETVALTLSDAQRASLGEPATATLVILDDEPRLAAAPLPCVRVPAPLATTIREDDNAEGERLGKARKDAREAAYPDRRMSPASSTNIPKVAEGWRYRWPELTGNRMQFVFFLSRDNALLSGTAFAPDPARCPGRRPVVVIGTGFGVDAEIRKWWAAQALAEAGYVAFTFDYLGQGFAEATGHTNPDGTGTPIPPACGDASCKRGADDRFGGLLDAQDAISFALSTPADPYRGGFDGQDGDTVFPFHDQVHPGWVGFAGHSRGAKIASVLPGMDPRLDATVAWDNLSMDLEGDAGSSSTTCTNGGLGFASGNIIAEPRVPSMGQAAPNGKVCGDPNLKKTAYFHWQAAGQPVMEVVLANTDHNTDWGPGGNSVPENPWGTGLAAYYTVAWFDLWLTRSGDDALERLSAREFNLFNHYTGPITISVTEALDEFYFSSVSIPGRLEREDLRN